MTAFGPGSFAVKLAFEGESVRQSVTGKAERPAAGVVPTVCFKPEEIDPALYYFLEDVKETVGGCNSWVAVVVGDVSRRDRLLEILGDPGRFIDKYINPDVPSDPQ